MLGLYFDTHWAIAAKPIFPSKALVLHHPISNADAKFIHRSAMSKPPNSVGFKMMYFGLAQVNKALPVVGLFPILLGCMPINSSSKAMSILLKRQMRSSSWKPDFIGCSSECISKRCNS